MQVHLEKGRDWNHQNYSSLIEHFCICKKLPQAGIIDFP